MTRPPFAEPAGSAIQAPPAFLTSCESQLEELEDGRIKFHLRRPAKNGQQSILLEPLQFLRRLAWLVPPPRQHQRRFYGVLAPNAKLRRSIVPHPPIRHASSNQRISWAQLLAKTYDIDAERCECGGRFVPIAVVTDPKTIRSVLRPANKSRAPPGQLSLLD